MLETRLHRTIKPVYEKAVRSFVNSQDVSENVRTKAVRNFCEQSKCVCELDNQPESASIVLETLCIILESLCH